MVTDAVIDAGFKSPAQRDVTLKVKFTLHTEGKPKQETMENLYSPSFPLTER